MTNEDHLTIEECQGFTIVRDDLFEGGTKRRAFRRLVDSIPESELVYACDYFGYAAYAIALTARDANKTVTLFYCSPKIATEVFRKTTTLSNVQYRIVESASTQMEAVAHAQAYAAENGARYLPVGLDFPEFSHELEKVVASARVHATEIWCLGASGTLARALQRAYPAIPVNTVNLGTADFEGGETKVHDAPEKWNEPAREAPPYPSTPYLDAKVWRFVRTYAKPGACIWNVA